MPPAGGVAAKGGKSMAKEDGTPTQIRSIEEQGATARIWAETPTLIVWIVDGRGTPELARKVTVELERLSPVGKPFEVFNDTERMSSIEPGFRNVLTDWSDSKKPHLRTIHILTVSKVVSMGAAVANMLLGGNIKMYSNRAAFEAAFRASGGTPKGLSRVA
jgi:hypothetical protein